MTDSDPQVRGGEQAGDGDRVDSTGGIERLLARNRERLAAGQHRLNDAIDRHRDRTLVELPLLVYQRDRESAGTVVSSALAFRMFLFQVPLVVLAVGIAGFLGSTLDEQDVTDAGITGTLAAQVASALAQSTAARWLAVGAGLFGMVLAGRTLSKVLVTASCLAWRLPVNPKASARATGAIIGLLVATGLALVVVNRLRDDHGIAVAGLSLIAALVVYTVAWLGMLIVLPRGTGDPGALIPGAVVVAATLTALQAVSNLILPGRFAQASQIYGTIGITLVVLSWYFIGSRAMVLSMELNAVIHQRYGSVTRFVFALPGLRFLAGRSAWLRDFFNLDD